MNGQDRAAPRAGFGWGKLERVRKHQHYVAIQSHGRRLGGKHLILVFAPSSFLYLRQGLTVSKRVGKAVVRNRVKRRLREIMRKNKYLVEKLDLIWIAKHSAAGASFAELQSDAQTLLAKVIQRISACEASCDKPIVAPNNGSTPA